MAKWVTVPEAADVLRIAASTIRYRAAHDQIPSKKVGNRVMIRVNANSSSDGDGASMLEDEIYAIEMLAALSPDSRRWVIEFAVDRWYEQ